MILTAIVFISGIAVLLTGKPTEPGFIASSDAQFVALGVFLFSSLLGLIGIPFRWRQSKLAAFLPPAASIMLFLLAFLGAEAAKQRHHRSVQLIEREDSKPWAHGDGWSSSSLNIDYNADTNSSKYNQGFQQQNEGYSDGAPLIGNP